MEYIIMDDWYRWELDLTKVYFVIIRHNKLYPLY